MIACFSIGLNFGMVIIRARSGYLRTYLKGALKMSPSSQTPQFTTPPAPLPSLPWNRRKPSVESRPKGIHRVMQIGYRVREIHTH